MISDVCDVELGCVSLKNKMVICYAARTLKPGERNYSAVERETCNAFKYSKKRCITQTKVVDVWYNVGVDIVDPLP